MKPLKRFILKALTLAAGFILFSNASFASNACEAVFGSNNPYPFPTVQSFEGAIHEWRTQQKISDSSFGRYHWMTGLDAQGIPALIAVKSTASLRAQSPWSAKVTYDLVRSPGRSEFVRRLTLDSNLFFRDIVIFYQNSFVGMNGRKYVSAKSYTRPIGRPVRQGQFRLATGGTLGVTFALKELRGRHLYIILDVKVSYRPPGFVEQQEPEKHLGSVGSILRQNKDLQQPDPDER